MMDGVLHNLLTEALRAMLLLAGPMVLAVMLAGLLVSALQSAFSISEPAVGYGARLAAVVLCLYLLLPTAVRLFTGLTQIAFQG